MAVLSIRSVPDDLHQRLRMRAARHGRSMESEARCILAEALEADEPLSPAALQDWVAKMMRGRSGEGMVDELLAERRREAQDDRA
jgi:plasmid stability protein